MLVHPLNRMSAEIIIKYFMFIYFSYLLLFFVLWRMYWKTNVKEKQGYLFGIFFAVLWSLRFVIEFLKEPQVDGREDWVFNTLNTGQVLSIPLVLIGLYFIFRKRK